MYGGESVAVQFTVREDKLNHVIDWFGKDIKVLGDDDGLLTIRVMCNRQAFFYWAIQYGLHVEVLKPLDLREEIAEATEKMYKAYHKGRD